MAPNNMVTARCTILSSNVGNPIARGLPSALASQCRFTGGAWYRPLRNRSCKSRKFSSRCSAYVAAVIPSIPGALSLRVRRYASRRKSTSIRCASVVKTISGYCFACSAIRWSCVAMVGDLEVSPICPPSRTVCPASPSLQWVPWASVPHLLRYCAPLRLPAIRLGSLRLRSLPNTLSASSLCVPCGSFMGGSSPPTPGLLFNRYPSSSGGPNKEIAGSPKFPSFPSDDMLRSPQTPVVSCPPRHDAGRIAAFHSRQSVGFLPGFNGDYPVDHHYTHFGAR